jgi:hypothetical protein
MSARRIHATIQDLGSKLSTPAKIFRHTAVADEKGAAAKFIAGRKRHVILAFAAGVPTVFSFNDLLS